jgi:hypothetical protein
MPPKDVERIREKKNTTIITARRYATTKKKRYIYKKGNE